LLQLGLSFHSGNALAAAVGITNNDGKFDGGWKFE